jgi:hypothetical protein
MLAAADATLQGRRSSEAGDDCCVGRLRYRAVPTARGDLVAADACQSRAREAPGSHRSSPMQAKARCRCDQMTIAGCKHSDRYSLDRRTLWTARSAWHITDRSRYAVADQAKVLHRRLPVRCLTGKRSWSHARCILLLCSIGKQHIK